MIEMRAAVENMAFRLCCREADPAAVQQLERDTRELKNAIDAGLDSSELPALIYKYHLDLCIQSGNNILPLVMNSFKEVSLELWRDWYQFQGPEETLETLQQYTVCIRENRPDDAIALYDKNAEIFLDWYKKCRLSLE
ncbi:MAG: FCD domain-containing protein [Eubacterium sp.]